MSEPHCLCLVWHASTTKTLTTNALYITYLDMPTKNSADLCCNEPPAPAGAGHTRELRRQSSEAIPFYAQRPQTRIAHEVQN